MSDFSGSTGRWIRHWRQTRRLTLTELAARVGCAPSHLSLIETGKREPRVSLLQDLADQLGVPVADLVSTHAPSERDALEVALERFQESPAYRETGLPIVRPGKTMPTAVLQALVGLHETLSQRDSAVAATPEEARRANAALRAEMRARDNYFGDIETVAHQILDAVQHRGGPVGERRIAQIAEHLGFSLHTVHDLPHSTRSVTDLRHRRIYLPASGWGGHDPRTITLQTLAHQVLGHQTPHDYAEFLRQRVEVNYFAAAILVNEEQAAQMLLRAKEGRYLAIEDLRDAFAVSYETAAHRFTNLITHHCGIRVHFLKVHENGMIYKAYENDGFALPTDAIGAIEGQAACRRWACRSVLLDEFEPGQSHAQYTDTPAGTFWEIAQTEHTSAGTFAVALGTTFDDARWFRGRETTHRVASTCPDPACCRRAPADLAASWAGRAWPSARAHAHLLSTLPPWSFPGVDETDVFAFLEKHAALAATTPSADPPARPAGG